MGMRWVQRVFAILCALTLVCQLALAGVADCAAAPSQPARHACCKVQVMAGCCASHAPKTHGLAKAPSKCGCQVGQSSQPKAFSPIAIHNHWVQTPAALPTRQPLIEGVVADQASPLFGADSSPPHRSHLRLEAGRAPPIA
jgi:hypothetical protein